MIIIIKCRITIIMICFIISHILSTSILDVLVMLTDDDDDDDDKDKDNFSIGPKYVFTVYSKHTSFACKK